MKNEALVCELDVLAHGGTAQRPHCCSGRLAVCTDVRLNGRLCIERLPAAPMEAASA